MEKVNGRLTAGVFPWGSALRESDIEGVSADALGWPKKHPGKVEDLRTVLGGVIINLGPDGGREGTRLI